jgi:hypothetical protein
MQLNRESLGFTGIRQFDHRKQVSRTLELVFQNQNLGAVTEGHACGIVVFHLVIYVTQFPIQISHSLFWGNMKQVAIIPDGA